MNLNFKFFIVFSAILLTLAAVLFVLPRDIHPRVVSVEGAVLEVLSKKGMSEKYIVYREERDWTSGNLRGSTLVYKFEKPGSIDFRGVRADITAALKKIKRVKVERSVHEKSGDGGDIFTVEITSAGQMILKIEIKSLPGGTGKKTGMQLAPEGSHQKRHRLVLVLDDFGYSKKNFGSLEKINRPLTLAVLPNAPYSREVCVFAYEHGMQVILHLPMEPDRDIPSLEADTIMVGMGDIEIREKIQKAFHGLVHVKGVSNHMGSRATSDADVMSTVMDELKMKDLFFLDSLTTDSSVCLDEAREAGVPFAKRDIFIDNVLENETIKQQLRKAVDIALIHGEAVAIGHDKSVTIEAIKEMVPFFDEKGVKIVPLSDIVKKRRCICRRSGQSRR